MDHLHTFLPKRKFWAPESPDHAPTTTRATAKHVTNTTTTHFTSKPKRQRPRTVTFTPKKKNRRKKSERWGVWTRHIFLKGENEKKIEPPIAYQTTARKRVVKPPPKTPLRLKTPNPPQAPVLAKNNHPRALRRRPRSACTHAHTNHRNPRRW